MPGDYKRFHSDRAMPDEHMQGEGQATNMSVTCPTTQSSSQAGYLTNHSLVPAAPNGGLGADTSICDTPRTQSPASSASMQSLRGSIRAASPSRTPEHADSIIAARANDLSIASEHRPTPAIKRECETPSGEQPPTKIHLSNINQSFHTSRASGMESGARRPRSPGHKQQRKARPNRVSQGPEKRHSQVLGGKAGGRLAVSTPSDTQPTLQSVGSVSYAAAAAAHPKTIPELERPQYSQSHNDPKPGAIDKPDPGGHREARNHSLKPGKSSTHRWQPAMQSKTTESEYSGMLLQPDSSPISEKALATEIQGIYSGVQTVELKCIDIDTALARDTKTQLGVEQWQALIALHRTLLYEHHDFLMATQHPSASPELQALATKYSMPARMWKHGIHAFLEVLRHRRPDSQDYMLAFVVLAYQMTALLYETVTCFTDTWIECLGDLARYRMAIEDDREMHSIWGGVAARWYTLASDRHPETGRLYHHLGILERPSMKKFASYAKSLTCSVPFLNARDSMTTFCMPIVQEEHLSKTNVGSAEALLVTYLALIFLNDGPQIENRGPQTEKSINDRETRLLSNQPSKTQDIESQLVSPSAAVVSKQGPTSNTLSLASQTVQSIADSGLRLLSSQPSTKTKDFGPQLILSSVAAVFEFGSASNTLWQCFSIAVKQEHHAIRSEAALADSTHGSVTPASSSTSASSQAIGFYFAAFNTVVRPQSTNQLFSDALASVHVILAWLHALTSLDKHNRDHSQDGTMFDDTISMLLNPYRFSWGELCGFLNRFCQENFIGNTIFEAARQGSLPGSQDSSNFVALAEDYWMRGLLWAQLYLPKGLLPARTDEIESPQCGDARVQRVQWLALSLAFRTKYIKYNFHTKMFEAPVQGPMVEPAPQPVRTDTLASTSTETTGSAPASRSSTWNTRSTAPTSPTSTARSSTTASTAEDSDGFTVVQHPKSKHSKRSYAKVAAASPPKKARSENKTVRIASPYDQVQ